MSYASNTLPISIEWAHCDPAGIVWNPHFFEFFDTGTWTLFERTLGVPRQNLIAHYGILGIPLVEAGANFVTPLRFGDRVDLVSTVTEVKRASFTISHRMIKNGRVAVDGQEIRVWAGRHPQDAARMSAAEIPADIVDKFKTAKARAPGR